MTRFASHTVLHDRRVGEFRRSLVPISKGRFFTAALLAMSLCCVGNISGQETGGRPANGSTSSGPAPALSEFESKHFANLRQGDYEMGLLAWVADVNDAGNFLYILQSSSVGSNYSRYRNPAFDSLMDKAAITTDLAARAGILRDAETLVMADQPIAPLYFAVNRNLVRARVKGWLQNPTDVHPSRYLSVEAP